jgi:hypothetical protein
MFVKASRARGEQRTFLLLKNSLAFWNCRVWGIPRLSNVCGMWDKATSPVAVFPLDSVGYVVLRVREVSLARRWRNLHLYFDISFDRPDMKLRIQIDEGMGSTGKHTSAFAWVSAISAVYGCMTSGLEKYASLNKAYVVWITGWLYVVSQATSERLGGRSLPAAGSKSVTLTIAVTFPWRLGGRVCTFQPRACRPCRSQQSWMA